MKIAHVTLVGFNTLNAQRLLFTVILIVAIVVIRYALHYAIKGALRSFPEAKRVRFWSHQGVNISTTVVFVIGLVSIWVGPNAHLATFGGLIGAGVAFALQQLIIAIAGYFIIMRGKSFSIGDRIIIGGVRGEVIALDFIQTTILEMGQPPSVESEASPAVWVLARQYTGRIVTVSNGEIFKEPIYNYSRDFPYIWEEIDIGVQYDQNYKRAEQILLEVAQRHTAQFQSMSDESRAHLHRIYNLKPPEVEPRVYYRMTSNWVGLSLRFLVRDREIRAVKDAMYRDILECFNAERIPVASSTYDIVGFPPVRLVYPPPPTE